MDSFQHHNELMSAMARRNIQEVQRLIDSGADLNYQVRLGIDRLPVHEAASRNFVEGLIALHAHGVDINSRDRKGNTALIGSAYYSCIEAGRWLLRHGADVRARQQDGESALYAALRDEHTQFADMMLEECPDLRDDETVAVAKKLIEMDLSVTVSEWLLGAGVSPCLTTPCLAPLDEERPWLFLAQFYSQDLAEDVTDLLLSKGAEINQQTSEGRTALHAAAEAKNYRMVMKLLAAGADPDLPDQRLQTARDIIVYCGKSQEMIDAFMTWDASAKARSIIDETSSVSTGLRPL